MSDNQANREPISFGPYRLHPVVRRLEKDGAPVQIGGRALDILLVLAERPGEVIGKRELFSRVWSDVHVDEGSLRFHVAALRKALGDSASSARYVINVPGRGYCLGSVSQTRNSIPSVSDGVSGRSSLPVAPELIGRIDTIDKVSAELNRHRFVTIVGTGGLGKTSVALAVAHRDLERFDGIAFIELCAVTDPKFAPFAVASALGLSVGQENPIPGLIAFLRPRRQLVILDSCEHVLDTLAPLAERIIRECSNLHILATSRESFRIDNEHVFRLFPLDCPPLTGGLTARDVLAYPAAQLFIDRVAASLGTFDLTDDEAPLVAEICSKVDGIALAIELAASRVNAFGISGTASMLNSRFALLWQGRRTAVPRHQTLSATLAWSYDLLSATESALLRQLSAFVGPFTLEAALAVAPEAGVDRSETMEILASLVAKSLVTTSSSFGHLRYRLLDTTRAYAADKLRAAAELKNVARQHAAYFLKIMIRAEAECETRPLAEWMADYSPHIDNIRAALDWAFSADGDVAIGVALTAATVPLWVRLSQFGECRKAAETALPAVDDEIAGNQRLRMQLLMALGWSLMYGEGRAREAAAALATTLKIADQLSDKKFRLRALWGLCIDQFNNGEFGKALEFAQQFEATATNSGDPSDLLLADRLMAVARHYLGDQTRARAHIDRVDLKLHLLAEQPKMFPLDLRISTHYFRARILWLEGQADLALALARRNVEEGRAHDHALTFCSVLGQSACPIAYLAGDFEAAERYGHELIEHTDHHAIRPWRLWAGAFVAMVSAKRGDRAALARLRDELDRAGDARFLPRFLPLLAELAACLGEADEVKQGFAAVEEALSRCKTREENWYVPELLRIRGELIRKDGTHLPDLSAEQSFRQSLGLATEQGALFWQLRSAVSLARLLAEEGRKVDAVKLLAPVYGAMQQAEIADIGEAGRLLDAMRS